MINLYNVYSRSKKIVARDTGDEYVLVPVTDNIADMKSVYTLNSTGAFIWNRIDGTRTVKEIVDEVEKEFDVEGKQALDDVLSFFSDMKEYLIIFE
ncbi:MAG: PqqD family protein [Bacteroidota bacterium]|nr:PqqD family protein [Bacteroidota bacterium]